MKLLKKTAAILVVGSILLSPVSSASFLFSSSAEAASAQTLSKGMKGSNVKALQEALSFLGYDCGTPDGSYGQKTYEAVKELQKDMGLDADGKAGPQTQDVIQNLVMSMGGSYATVAPDDASSSPTETPKAEKTDAPSGQWESAYVTKGWLKMRESASTGATVLKSIPGGTELRVYDRGSKWCSIVYGGKAGYVMTEYLTFGTPPSKEEEAKPTPTKEPETEKTAAPEKTTAPTKAPEASVNYDAYTNSIWLKLRKSPSTGATILKSIPGKTRFTVTEKGDTWCKAVYGGKAGYVMTKYVVFGSVPTSETEAPEAKPTETATVTATPEPVITATPKPAVTATAEPVVTPSPSPSPTPTKVPTPKPDESGAYTVITTSTWLKLREEPSTSATVLASIPGNTPFTVTEKGATWCAAEYDGTKGYVMSKYLVFTGSPKPTATPTAPAVQTPAPPTPTPKKDTELSAYVKGGALNLRQSASTDSKKLDTIPNKTLLVVYEKGETWSKVIYDNTVGYVMTKYLDFTSDTPAVTPTPPPSTPVSPTGKPDTSLILKAGASGEQVVLMQNRLVDLGYLSAASGTYDSATTAAVKAFQKEAGISTDGVAGPITLKKLYGDDITAEGTPIPQLGAGVGKITPPAASSVQLLHWNDYIKTKYRSGQKVLVYDPASGLAWHFRFYAMGRHADSEPVTAEDTLIMYYAFGMKNTWTPKAVWVQLPGGEWTMATMHNVPHLSGSIKTNDFDGHLCVHFLRDMSECTKNDPKYGVQHQNALRKAWKALTGETVP
ncbi:MAG: SH3 domain-containing protein [Eubacteriales bacterium]|nr:SH3 domain-containing protein [Eubacteriales bacterium]MDD3880810.1 SH3 domain-containing protein [Eubacteriales bacterium]MDD4511823.1 SH3 domain-containing protein [Eubacteriales bacterium]